MIRRALPATSLAAVLLLCVPALAEANPLDILGAAPQRFRPLLREKLHSRPNRGSFASESRISLKSQHGYRLAVIGQGNVVALVVTRDRGRRGTRSRSRTMTAYVTRGRATRTRIKGSFGSFGSVALRFRPSGRVVTHDPRGCRKHAHFTYRYGTFVGRIRFTGEDHYVAVRAHRAKGRVRTPLRLHCRRLPLPVPLAQRKRRPARHRPSAFAALFAERREVTTSTQLLALRGGRTAVVLATAEETLGKMAELHSGLAVVPGSSLRHDNAVTSATLDPPPPFHGKGFYSAAPDGTTTWTGPLSIAFPGAPRQPLTGPDFAVELDVGF